MAQEKESNMETAEAVDSAKDLYQEYFLELKEQWNKEWSDELEGRDSNVSEEERAETLASHYAKDAKEGGNSNQVVFYLEKTDLGEKEKWEILAQNFEARADFVYQKADDARNKKEKVKFKARVNIYKNQAQTLRRGIEALK